MRGDALQYDSMKELVMDDDTIKKLVRDIDSVQGPGEIKIFAGEGNCSVYDNPEVCKAFKRGKKRGVEIKMILGPILSVSEDTGKSRLTELAEDTIEVFYRPFRHMLPHYRVLKDSSKLQCYVEAPNPAREAELEVPIGNNSIWARKLDSDFDGFISVYGLKPYKDLTKVFILLRPSQIEELRRKSEDRGIDLEYLNKDDIENLLNYS